MPIAPEVLSWTYLPVGLSPQEATAQSVKPVLELRVDKITWSVLLAVTYWFIPFRG